MAEQNETFSTDLIIIGAGCAGLMAGTAAGEAAVRTLMLERKNKPGRKLLMCGNSRCNLTTNISHDRMLQLFGEPMSTFLHKAFNEFTPSGLQRWFANNGLKTVVRTGNKVYPDTERATDVLNMFTNELRRHDVPLCVSAPVTSITKHGSGYFVQTENFSMTTRYIILSTGGISYPGSGALGDGQKFADKLGHKIEPYQAGLVGYDVDEHVLEGRIGQEFDKVKCKLFDKNGKEVHEAYGVYKIEKWGIGGTAVTNTSRQVARYGLTDYRLEIIFEDGRVEKIKPLNPRPVKEAQVTIGGITLEEVNNKTMESYKNPGLYFAGEVMDVDGPTGGYNLHASFACARLAVADIASKLGKELPAQPVQEKKNKKQSPYENKSQNTRNSQGNKRGNSDRRPTAGKKSNNQQSQRSETQSPAGNNQGDSQRSKNRKKPEGTTSRQQEGNKTSRSKSTQGGPKKYYSKNRG